MFRRFGPFDLFSLADKTDSKLKEAIDDLFQRAKKSKAKGWKVFVLHKDDIEQLATWAFSKRKQIAREFPRLKSGDIYKNRHLIVKQYDENIAPSGQSLFSHGFEGTNFRLVIASDKDRQLKCQFGEHLNLSGTPLMFREGYPMAEHCAFCNSTELHLPCQLCGHWYCKNCSFTCKTCGHEMCISCSTPNAPNMSAHNWYYHRN